MFGFLKKKKVAPVAVTTVDAAAGTTADIAAGTVANTAADTATDKTADATADSTPTPIAGRDGHVGAVESLVLDGTTWFFGFDYGADLAVSPLIDDIDQMARFCSRHMEQRDGPHDEAYWRDMVEISIEDSELSSEPGSRVFSTEALAAVIASLDGAIRTNTSTPGFALPYHLQYLLGAAGGWTVETDGFEYAIAVVAGEETPVAGEGVADVATWLRGELKALTQAAPGNWSTLFKVLTA